MRGKCAEPCSRKALQDRAGDRDAPHRQQFVEMELQAHTEHQQDDADFCELLRKMHVRGVSRRVGTHDDAREQVADDRRQAKPLRDVATDESGAQPGRKRENEPGFRHVIAMVVRRRRSLSRSICDWHLPQ